MKSAKFAGILVAIVALSVVSSEAIAQKIKNLPFRRAANTQADDSFALTESAGPWLIMCAAFDGETGMADARQLASELRSHKLNAYVYRHTLDRSGVVEGIGWELYVDELGNESHRPKTMKHAIDAHQEVAVLVGDFPTVEDARAQRILKQIKQFKPSAWANLSIAPSTQRLRNWREFARRTSIDPDNKEKGPLGTAFLMPNPKLPEGYFDAYRVDHFVMKLNKRVRHSLLENPHDFSVRVATFRGDATFDLNEIAEKEKEMNILKRIGKPVNESRLAQAADKAHKLTKALRRLGVDAYEFHDRNESFVCVGGFDWASKGEGPNKVLNPEIIRVIEKFKGSFADLPNMQGAFQPKQLKEFKNTDIVFDLQPVPVRVPKYSTASIANGGRWR